MSERVNYRFKEAKKKPTQANVVCDVPSKLAMRLALAYYVEQCIEDGTLESYADAARRLGITRARMTQVMDLMLTSRIVLMEILSRSIDTSGRCLEGDLSDADTEYGNAS